MSASKAIVRLHSSASYAEGHVLTGQSNAYTDIELNLHTVLIACWQVKLECSYAVHLCNIQTGTFQTRMAFIFNPINQTSIKKLNAARTA